MASVGAQQHASGRCKCKYRPRWFYSKGAFLVLGWCLLESVAGFFTLRALASLFHNLSFWYGLIPGSIALLGLLFSGWLADRKFGNYRVVKFGLILMFLATLSVNMYTLFLSFHFTENQYVSGIAVGIISSLAGVGMASSSLMSLQLGLDQMPDASSSSIASFVAWFVFSAYAGVWISNIFSDLHWRCVDYHYLSDNSILQIWSLHPVLCISVILISDYLFAKKWLIIEPKSPQSLKSIYRVLKFAAKHKAPLNRSALTYWEEDIPSRLDLGKSKYGGPFTTEQVEDVKTILRLLVLGISLLLVAISVLIPPLNNSHTDCGTDLLFRFTYDGAWCSVVSIVIFEFTIYPIMGRCIPSIIKRIGIISLLTAILSVIFLSVELIHYFLVPDQLIVKITSISLSVSHGVLSPFLVIAATELILAQAPYNIRGLFASYTTILIVASLALGEKFTESLVKYCSSRNADLIILSVKLVLSLFGFVLYCLLARWYKRRVRDDVYSAHRVVEEVYDRYLTAAETHQVARQR